MINLYGPFLALGFLLGSFIVWRRAKEEAYDEEKVFDAIVVSLFFGLLGARLHFIFINLSYFGTNLMKWFWLTRYAGLRWYGGLLGGFLGLAFFGEKARWGFWPTADIAVFGLALGQAVGLIGSFFNEYDFSQILEAVLIFVIYLILLRLERSYRLFTWYLGDKGRAEPGFLALVYLILSSLVKLGLAIFRGDPLYLSGFFLIAGIIGLYQRSGREFESDRRLVINRVKMIVRQKR